MWDIHLEYQIRLEYLSKMCIFLWDIHLRYGRPSKMWISIWDVRLGLRRTIWAIYLRYLPGISQINVHIPDDVHTRDGRPHSQGSLYPRLISQVNISDRYDIPDGSDIPDRCRVVLS